MTASLRTRALDRLRRSWPDLAIVSALLALFFLVHRFVECVEIGGDAISKWHFVRQWFYDNDFSQTKWDHHHTRMGVNGVTWLVQLVFGREWRAYYVGPFAMAALQLPLAYVLGKRLGSRLTGVLAALFITFLPAVHRSASQLLPDGYAGTYALIGAYCFARYVEAEEERRRLRWLGAVCVAAFVGYLTKETFFFFYPAFVIGLWLVRRRLRDAAIFCVTLLLGLGLETLAYRVFTKYGSRLAIVRSVHGANDSSEPAPTLSVAGFLKPLTSLDREWQLLLAAAFFGCALLLVLNRRSIALGRLIAMLGLSHVGMLSISAQLYQNPLPRYMDPVAPIAALAAAALFSSAVSALGRIGFVAKLSTRPLLQRFGPGERPGAAAAWVIAAIAVIAFVVHRSRQADPPFDGWAQGRAVAEVVNRTYERNLPIAAPNRTAKTLMTVYDVYLDDSKLARDGKLPEYREAKQRYRKLAYVVKQPRAYRGKVFERLLGEGCVVQLRRGSRGRGTRGYVDIKPLREPPAKCDALLAALQRK